MPAPSRRSDTPPRGAARVPAPGSCYVKELLLGTGLLPLQMSACSYGGFGLPGMISCVTPPAGAGSALPPWSHGQGLPWSEHAERGLSGELLRGDRAPSAGQVLPELLSEPQSPAGRGLLHSFLFLNCFCQ